jgi:uncharacterized tellurite resistance protein B-like protein
MSTGYRFEVLLALAIESIMRADGDPNPKEMSLFSGVGEQAAKEAMGIIETLGIQAQSGDYDFTEHGVRIADFFKDSVLSLREKQRIVINLFDVALCDGSIHPEEEKIINRYLTNFGLDTAFVKATKELISIKHGIS